MWKTENLQNIIFMGVGGGRNTLSHSMAMNYNEHLGRYHVDVALSP